MTVDEVLAEFAALATEQNRKVYRRHDAKEPIFGVSFANLGALKKRIRRDQALAECLWKTGGFEAQSLAALIADPAACSPGLLDDWAGTANNHGCADSLAKEVVIHTPHAVTLAAAWIDSDDARVQRAGWSTVGCLALFDDSLDDGYFLAFLPRIEATVHTAPNRIKEAMNSTLIAIGGRSEVLRLSATEAARRIGKVKVDHGQTNCKTPDAISYIEKMWVRKLARAGV